MKYGLDRETYDRLKSLLEKQASVSDLIKFNSHYNIVPNINCCLGKHIDIRASMIEAILHTDRLNEENT